MEAVKAVLKGPYTAKFPAEPSVPPPNFRGRPEYDADECVGCGACYEVCPAGAISMADDVEAKPPVRKLEVSYDQCIFCGQCELNCTTEKGIKLTTEYDLATFDRSECRVSVEKELVLCEACGKVVGALDHLVWIAEKIGPKRFANPNLMLAYDALRGPDGELAAPAAGPVDGGPRDVMRMLCPECRRSTLLKEMWG